METALLDKASIFIRETKRQLKRFPGAVETAAHLNCSESSAKNILQYFRVKVEEPRTVSISATEKPEVTETQDISENHWNITIPHTTIHTLEQLIERCQVDTNIWHCERFVANKWEVVMKPAAFTELFETKDGREIPLWERDKDKIDPIHEPLYQIKAFFVRKEAEDIGGYIKKCANLRSRLAKAERELRDEKAISKHLSLFHMGYDEFKDKLSAFMDTIGDLSLPYERTEAQPPFITPLVSTGHTEDAVALWSDQHFGDRIRREDTSGFPMYDLLIGGNRWGYVQNRTKQILTLHRSMYPLDMLNVWVGGDVGNGILHDSPNSNELFSPAQVHFSYHMLKFAIEDLLKLTEPDEHGNVIVKKIKLLFSVGNHMRLDEKMPHKYQAQRTLDWLIYMFVIDRFRGNPKIEIVEDMSPFIFHNIRGHRYMFAHGLQVGYKNSPDAQCKSMSEFLDRTRALFDSPEWRKANALQGETFERVCIGDIHVPVSFPRLISNGSLNGQNELGVNWALEPIPAGQQLFGVSNSHQETWHYFVECSQIQDKPKDLNKYGEFARNYADKLGR